MQLQNRCSLISIYAKYNFGAYSYFTQSAFFSRIAIFAIYKAQEVAFGDRAGRDQGGTGRQGVEEIEVHILVRPALEETVIAVIDRCARAIKSQYLQDDLALIFREFLGISHQRVRVLPRRIQP